VESRFGGKRRGPARVAEFREKRATCKLHSLSNLMRVSVAATHKLSKAPPTPTPTRAPSPQQEIPHRELRSICGTHHRRKHGKVSMEILAVAGPTMEQAARKSNACHGDDQSAIMWHGKCAFVTKLRSRNRLQRSFPAHRRDCGQALLGQAASKIGRYRVGTKPERSFIGEPQRLPRQLPRYHCPTRFSIEPVVCLLPPNVPRPPPSLRQSHRL